MLCCNQKENKNNMKVIKTIHDIRNNYWNEMLEKLRTDLIVTPTFCYKDNKEVGSFEKPQSYHNFLREIN